MTAREELKKWNQLNNLWISNLVARESMKFLFSAENDTNTDKKFAPISVIIFLTVVTVVVLFLLFPKKELMRNIAQQRQADIVALKYLQNLLEIYPLDINIKLLLAEQNISRGDIQKTIRLITPYMKQKPVTKNDWRALWLYYQVIRTETYAAPEISYARIKGLKRMRDILQRLAVGPLPPNDLLQLADDALSVNNPKLSIAIYKKIIAMKITPTQSSEVYVRAAKNALAYGEYKICAKLYFLAQQQATILDARRKYYISGLKALQSGNLLDNIMNVAQQHLGELKDDQATLLFLNNLAIAANKPNIAETHIKKALQLEHLNSKNK
jgi:hypothetical protein